jgi:hypothetical protein
MPTEPKQVCVSVGWTVEYAFYHFKERGMTTLFYRPIDSHPKKNSMPKLKNILNTIADELFSVDNGGNRPVTVNDLRLIVTALLKEIKEDEERANDRLTQGKLARLK